VIWLGRDSWIWVWPRRKAVTTGRKSRGGGEAVLAAVCEGGGEAVLAAVCEGGGEAVLAAVCEGGVGCDDEVVDGIGVLEKNG